VSNEQAIYTTCSKSLEIENGEEKGKDHLSLELELEPQQWLLHLHPLPLELNLQQSLLCWSSSAATAASRLQMQSPLSHAHPTGLFGVYVCNWATMGRMAQQG
jgi:hypothetical protein